MKDGKIYSSYGTAARYRTEAELSAGLLANLHSEVRRRVFAICRDCPIPPDDIPTDTPKDLGIGSAYRSAAQQDALHKSQPTLSPPSGGSYHEAVQTNEGMKCLAVDFLNFNASTAALYWCRINGHLYGLVFLWDVNGEKWHAQPLEVPRSRRNRYDPTLHAIVVKKLPGATPPVPPVVIPPPHPIPTPTPTNPTKKAVIDMLIVAKQSGKGPWFVSYDGGITRHHIDGHKASIVAANGMIDAKTAKKVTSWGAVQECTPAEIEEWLGKLV